MSVTRILLPDRQSSEASELAPGLSMQWKQEGRVLTFTLNTTFRPTIDIWRRACGRIVTDWNPAEPLLVFLDFSGMKATMLPHLRSRIGEIIDLREDVSGRLAMVMPEVFFANAVRLFMTGSLRSSKLERRVFHDMDSAWLWLEESLSNKQ